MFCRATASKVLNFRHRKLLPELNGRHAHPLPEAFSHVALRSAAQRGGDFSITERRIQQPALGDANLFPCHKIGKGDAFRSPEQTGQVLGRGMQSLRRFRQRYFSVQVIVYMVFTALYQQILRCGILRGGRFLLLLSSHLHHGGKIDLCSLNQGRQLHQVGHFFNLHGVSKVRRS